jgi:Flp pilus assembly protein CpaB
LHYLKFSPGLLIVEIEREGMGTIVVAARPPSFGTTLTAEDVTEIPWGARSLPEGAFASKDEFAQTRNPRGARHTL